MFRLPLAAFRKAHEIIWKLGYWRYLFVPVLLTGLLVPLILWFNYLISNWLLGRVAALLPEGFNSGGWLGTLFTILVFLLGLPPSYVLFRALVLLFYAPFLDRLAGRVGELNGETYEITRVGLAVSIVRMLIVNFTALGASIALAVIGFVLGFIPFLGVVMGVLLIFPLQLFLGGWVYLDPALERRGLGMIRTLAALVGSGGTVCVFSLLSFLLSAIPVVGWFLGPTYAVVAGIVLGEHLQGGKSDGGSRLAG